MLQRVDQGPFKSEAGKQGCDPLTQRGDGMDRHPGCIIKSIKVNSEANTDSVKSNGEAPLVHPIKKKINLLISTASISPLRISLSYLLMKSLNENTILLL